MEITAGGCGRRFGRAGILSTTRVLNLADWMFRAVPRNATSTPNHNRNICAEGETAASAIATLTTQKILNTEAEART